MLRTAIAFSLTLAAVPALAANEIYKCVDPAGKVEYRNSTCPSGTQSAPVEVPVASGKIIEIRRSGDRAEGDVKDAPERPRSRPSERVNALPPPPPEKEKQD